MTDGGKANVCWRGRARDLNDETAGLRQKW